MDELKLAGLTGYKSFAGPLVTVVMDGVGLGKQDASDGVWVSHTPVLDSLFEQPLFRKLKAHGTAVGLPADSDMGNSEVGHNALGAGRVFAQGAKLVNAAIASGAIFSGHAWKEVRQRAAAGGTVHFLGMISDGNVHSHLTHLTALLEQAARDGFERVRVHTLLDGRDVAERSALVYLEPLEALLARLSVSGRDYRIASGGGRMVTTMDRYNANWAVVENGWKAHVLGEGRQFASATEAVKAYYDEDPKSTDQYLDSFVIAAEGKPELREGSRAGVPAGSCPAQPGKPVGTIQDGDAVVFFNFRGDRAIQISRAFEEPEFHEFDRKRVPRTFYAGMMQYDGDALIPKNYLVEPPAIDRTLGQYLCSMGVTSFAISETQKYGHVTYFWNGNNSGYLDEKLEKYVEIPSDRITFDLRPWMKAAEITDELVRAVAAGRHKFLRVNYANGDMVGHTGIEPAIRVAVETVDLCLGRLRTAVQRAGGILMVLADHGNADLMWEEKRGKRTPVVSHTLNPVPFVVEDFSGANHWALTEVDSAGLSNVAATIATLLGFEPPEDYDRPLLRL